MDNLLEIKPGLLIWTFINFGIFLFLLIKFGTKPIAAALKARENKITDSVASAEKANADAQQILLEVQRKLDTSRSEVADIISKGRKQAEEIINKATEEAEKVKKQKLNDAIREIEAGKIAALNELRSEVADLVVQATEKILDEKLDKDRDYKLIDSFIKKIPSN